MLTSSGRNAAFAVCLAVTLPSFAASSAAAQNPLGTRKPRPSPSTPAPAVISPHLEGRGERIDEENAQNTRRRLEGLLRQYPPSLSEVLRLDPSLLTNEAYLAPYPLLAAFLGQHPDVAHNPGYFVGEVRFNQSDPQRDRIRAWQETLVGFEVLLGIATALYIFGSILKSLIDYRRWLSASKVQSEVHSKLMDRLTSNEDLLAYMQSPAGRRYLEAAPIPIDAGPRPISAPVGRILWSVQAGFVAALGGVALLYVSARMAAETSGASEMAAPLFLIGMLALAIGVGFVLSAVVAYMLSQRLGLFERPAITPHA